MALFSGKIVSAQFIDPPNNMLIEVLYQEGDIVTPHVLEVDFTQPDLHDLLKEVTLDEIEKNTKAKLKVEQDNLYKIIEEKVSNEIERRWANESEKVKLAYDKAEKYAQEIIERDLKEIDEAWGKIKTEYNKLEIAWKSFEEESTRLNKTFDSLEGEFKKIDIAWEEISGESNRIQKSWEEISGESEKMQKAWQDIEQGYKKVDEYAEGEKIKKFEEVQSEFQKLRQELAVRFSNASNGSSSTKLEAKDLFKQLAGNEGDADFVFNLKISILEDPDIAKSKDKAMKLAIRKAKTVTELLAIYYAQKAA